MNDLRFTSFCKPGGWRAVGPSLGVPGDGSADHTDDDRPHAAKPAPRADQRRPA